MSLSSPTLLAGLCLLLASCTSAGEDTQAPPSDITVPAGPVSGTWCGSVALEGSVSILPGERLEICEGSEIWAPTAAVFEVQSGATLAIQGTSEAPVRWTGPDWTGLVVEGRLEGVGLELRGAVLAIESLEGSSIELSDVTIAESEQSLRLAGDSTWDRLTVLGGYTARFDGGLLVMRDSVIDLGHPAVSPDCTGFNGGGATLEHVWITGCHCPLHFNRMDEAVTVTDSILDDAAYAVMLTQTSATFRGNHLASSNSHILDIGGSFFADVAGNYWEGGAPNLSSADMSQFVGVADYATEPFADVGPQAEAP